MKTTAYFREMRRRPDRARILDECRDAAHKQLRVVDESGEDYLFPAALFVPIEVPSGLRRALLAAV